MNTRADESAVGAINRPLLQGIVEDGGNVLHFILVSGFQPNGEEDACRMSLLPSGKRGRSSLTRWQTASRSRVSCRLLKGRTSTWTTSEPHCTRPGNWKKGKSRCQVA